MLNEWNIRKMDQKPSGQLQRLASWIIQSHFCSCVSEMMVFSRASQHYSTSCRTNAMQLNKQSMKFENQCVRIHSPIFASLRMVLLPMIRAAVINHRITAIWSAVIDVFFKTAVLYKVHHLLSGLFFIFFLQNRWEKHPLWFVVLFWEDDGWRVMIDWFIPSFMRRPWEPRIQLYGTHIVLVYTSYV